jgi:hypothetical protein
MVGVIVTSFLYAVLVTFGVSKNTSLLIAFAILGMIILLIPFLFPKLFHKIFIDRQVLWQETKLETNVLHLREESDKLLVEITELETELQLYNLRLSELQTQFNAMSNYSISLQNYIKILENELEKMKTQQNEPSENGINGWLSILSSNLGNPLSRVSTNHWQLGMRNSVAAYTLDIFDHGLWVTYSSVLVSDVVGSEKVTLYTRLLELNTQLNDVHIGRADNKIILTREEPKERLTLVSLGESIIIFNNAHEIVYTSILEDINKLGLKATNQ